MKSSSHKHIETNSTPMAMTFPTEKLSLNLKNSNMLFETTLQTPTPNKLQIISDIKTNPLVSNQKTPNSNQFKIGRLGILSANLALLTLLTLRWFESGHFPLSNLYESLMFLSWSLTLFHLVLETITLDTLTFLGAMTSPAAFFTNAFANFSLPKEMQHSSALVPALQSNWLMMHVTVMILSYAALIFGSLLSISFLILTFSVSSEQYEKSLRNESPISTMVKFSNSKIRWAQILDNLSYRMLGIGFPLLTIGILSGAVWANEAWGSYWSWDPKETWALLTWLVFAIYLHTRITKNWQGKKPAMIASFGFIVVWICYLGVNLLGEGLHSYGWIQS
uniref:Cytochrome c biogenesis protein CcsA n=1 Tax=Ourococcus multisporus TaxID=132186 RepID=A0A140GIV9_9CHLO|nr:heme attachment to plastid cytochrome c [Ourococcus multisporus]